MCVWYMTVYSDKDTEDIISLIPYGPISTGSQGRLKGGHSAKLSSTWSTTPSFPRIFLCDPFFLLSTTVNLLR